jgi:hypothetical protein
MRNCSSANCCCVGDCGTVVRDQSVLRSAPTRTMSCSTCPSHTGALAGSVVAGMVFSANTRPKVLRRPPPVGLTWQATHL